MLKVKPKRTAKSAGKKSIRGKGWKRPINIPLDKYQVVSKAILKTLTSKPMRFSELAAKVKKGMPAFSGSVSWYTVSALRALENEGKVVRTKGKVVTYHRS